MPKELGLFYVILLTTPLYNQWDQFTTVQVNLTIPPYQMPLYYIYLYIYIYFKDSI